YHHTFSAPQLKVAVQGTGAPVMLSHALGLDLHMWDDFAAHLAAERTVLRYDQRGHGGSARPPGPYAIDDLVDDAARLIREWGPGPGVFLGLSMGGMGAAPRSSSSACRWEAWWARGSRFAIPSCCAASSSPTRRPAIPRRRGPS